jgi:hypothetical protein
MTTTIITITRMITRTTMIIIMIITGITTIMITTTTMITARNCRKPPSGCVRWKLFCLPKAMSIRMHWI